ncbi:tail fiber domain-containing protein [Blastococcus sp. CCUG 61487]|uniref:tail fiber domain-containing protein n=1 Tax=Blastococcus sp. CCUG 61487 TaxID=1840703 RepID=UPI0010C0E6EE|nr:tail fiber domain-containing protein [Blastococcus sp. CCUG 61487]TKJ25213.1 hypothetical protein A6V29_04110 [Blastococcus sp. CCUG 61487]
MTATLPLDDPLVLELEALREELAEVRGQIPSIRRLTVTDTDPATGTFTVAVPGAEELPDLAAGSHFLPAAGDEVELELHGATPVLRPGRIAEGAITERELYPTVVEKITVGMTAANGKNKVSFSLEDPSGPGTAVGDPWFKRESAIGPIVGAWAWDGDSWEPATFGDEVLSSLTVAKLVGGTAMFDLIIGGRVASAYSGQRYELNSLALQGFDDDETLTIHLDGKNNLLMGQIVTGPPGTRRVIVGASGSIGEVRFESGQPGVDGIVRSFSVGSGFQAIQMILPVPGASATWNNIQIESDEEIFLNSKLVAVKVGGAAAASGHYFSVIHVPDKASPNANMKELFRVNPTDMIHWGDDGSRFQRFGANGNVMFATSTANRYQSFADNGEVIFRNNTASFSAFIPPDAGNFDMSARLKLVNTRSVGVSLRAWYDALGAPTRLEVRDGPDTGFVHVWAAGYEIQSDAAGKTNIREATGSLAMLRGMRPKRYRMKPPAKAPKIRHGFDDVETDELIAAGDDREYIGLVAQDVHPEMQVQGSSGLGVDLYAVVSRLVGAVGELADQVDDLRKDGKP